MATVPPTLLARWTKRLLLLAVLGGGLVGAGCGGGGLLPDIGGLSGGGSPVPGGAGTAEAMSPGELQFAQEVLRLTNQERVSRGLAALAWDERASSVAHGHSHDMDARRFFAHVNPDGQDPGMRLAAAGVGPVSWWGENIARGQTSPQEVVSAWMASEGHRENILNGAFTHLGVGVHAPGSVWWTQVFLRY